jgi:hypothetical protein
MDKGSTSDLENIKKKALDLEIAAIKVIPVALGNEANENELTKTTPQKQNLIKPDGDEPANRTAEKIIIKAIKGQYSD